MEFSEELYYKAADTKVKINSANLQHFFIYTSTNSETFSIKRTLELTLPTEHSKQFDLAGLL